MRISDWSSDVCSSDLAIPLAEPGIDVDFRDTAGGATVSGDTVMLREAVKNVLDNAVRHGRAGAGGGIVIRLFTDRADGARCLSVSDGGPGIAAPDRARAFAGSTRGYAAGRKRAV